jgi:hypothetical protein
MEDRHSRFAVKYRFNQIETALIAFCGDIEKKINQILPSTPVFIQHTGDYSYYMIDKFVNSTYDDVIQKTPRVVITPRDFQYLSDQNTHQYNKIEYQLDNEIYVAEGRRLGVNYGIDIDFVSPNYIFALEHFEILSTIIARDNVYTYEFLGNTYESAYVLQSVSSEAASMEVSSATRNTSVRMSFELHVHLFVPIINSITPLADTIKDAILFEGVNKSSQVSSNEKDKKIIYEIAGNDNPKSDVIVVSQ